MRTIEADITEALSSGGLSRNSVEASVMEVEQRAGAAGGKNLHKKKLSAKIQ